MDLTNSMFKEADDYFKKCCEAVDLTPSTRQASKFRNNRGKAYTEGRNMISKVKEKDE